ncbi:MAG: 3'(2'),5'-bisphosphate nucleotidase CysQ [Chitinivibrionales bacterium]|nr:3'(2'),5'-bisphosphate nucleotidase CysQ [Chitinivibrionales bacterium]
MHDPRLPLLTEIARQAGSAIMDVYYSDDFDAEMKADNSPLTRADTASHNIITKGLHTHFPNMPLISEEGKDTDWDRRKDWQEFWLVDPLDGTKEFIRKEHDFTVNIALVEQNLPTIGIVYAPARDWLYYGIVGDGAYKVAKEHADQLPLNVESCEQFIAVGSKSHAKPEEDTFLAQFSIKEKTSMGSSLKFCLVAEGAADIYYRYGPTWEWDTAAAHAIVRAAGGSVISEGEELRYNKPPLKNRGFVCVRNAAILSGKKVP